jgi:hypothetical protein
MATSSPRTVFLLNRQRPLQRQRHLRQAAYSTLQVSAPSLPSISEPVLHDVRHSRAGSARIIAACPYKAQLEQRREHKPTDTGKKHNCQNYVCKFFTDYQQDKSERENTFAGKRRPTKPMANMGRRVMKLQFRTDR